MRFTKSFALIFVLLLGMTVVPAIAQNSGRTVEQEVARQLRLLSNYNVFDYIDYRVENGVVTLSGWTNSLGTKYYIERALKRQDGITAVVNNIEELPPSRIDDRIRIATLRTFAERGPARYFSGLHPDVRITVKNGNIILNGVVSNVSDRDVLNILANSVPGVFSVTNNIKVGKTIS
ncbi:MAG: BON domain-containing protein [Acidobacteriota bacterium]|nr:MAG: BON domain-containing protein [Acidobacteriota bacterium]